MSEAERTTLDWPRHAGTTAAVLQEMEEQVKLRRRRQRRLRGAAGALVLLLAAGWGAQSRFASPADPGTPAVAALPGRQVLPDGSVVLLRDDATLQVEFTAALRRVVLTRGEALFDVEKNPQRPFVVHVAGVDVRAVGTAFAVNLKDAAVEVLVTEGKVAVEKSESALAPSTAGAPASNEPPAEPLAWVPARSRVVVAFGASASPARPEVVPVSDDEIDLRLAWRVARLQFARTPLREAVAMVNQHARTRLILDGAGLDNVRVSGAIRADNITALLQFLESDHGIQSERRGEHEIVLRKIR